MLPGVFIILLFYAVGEGLAYLTGNFVPGCVIGMILLFLALYFKWVSPRKTKPVSKALTGNMSLFFLPAGVGVANSFDLLSASWRPVLAASLLSTLAVLVVVAVTAEWFTKRKNRHVVK